MFYYLTDFVWSGSPEDGYFLPRGTDGLSGWTCIDFRPDCTADAGLVVLAVPFRDDATFGAAPIAESSDERLPLSMRRKIGNEFGVTIDSGRLDDTLFELLYDYGDDTRTDRWNSLKPTHGGYEVLLGNEQILFVPEVSGGASYTESFNTADGTTLGPNQTWTQAYSGTKIVSNHVEVQYLSGWSWARAGADTSTSNNAVSVALTLATSASSGGGGAICRHSSTAVTGYEAGRLAIDNNLSVSKVVTGTRTILGTSAFTWALATYTLRVSANGSSIVGSRDSTGTVVRVTDTSVTSGTRGGFVLYATSATSRAQIDNWTLDDCATTTKSLGTVTISTTRSLTKKASKKVSASASGSPSLRRTAKRTASLAVSSVLTAARKATKALLPPSPTASPSTSRAVSKRVFAGVSPSTAAVRKVKRTIAMTVLSASTASKRIVKAFSRSVLVAGSLAVSFVDYVVTFVVSMSLSVSSTASTFRRVGVRRGFTATAGATVSKATRRSMTFAAAVFGSLLQRAVRRVSLATSAAVAGSTARAVRKRVALVASSVVTLSYIAGLHTFKQVVTASVSASVSAGKKMRKGLSVALRKVAVFVFDE